MFQKLLRFTGMLFVVIAILYGIQRCLMEYFFSLHELDFLHFSYKFNFGITLLFTSTIILISEKLKDQVGFVFLAEGMLKIGLFLYLIKNMGFEINKSNFLVFFVPYLGALFVELYFVMRILKDMDRKNTK